MFDFAPRLINTRNNVEHCLALRGCMKLIYKYGPVNNIKFNNVPIEKEKNFSIEKKMKK